MTNTEELLKRLAEPFDAAEIKVKPGAVSGNRALALHFVDARVIQDRLDGVLGVTNWQDTYEVLADGSVVCKLQVRLDGEWITKMDVGGLSEQPDEGDRRKAAFSDALKRAAVKFGIGRYLYRIPQQWLDYDPAKRRFVNTPALQIPPVVAQQMEKPTATERVDTRERGLAILKVAAERGIKDLETAWKTLSSNMQSACQRDLKTLKEQAASVDANRSTGKQGVA